MYFGLKVKMMSAAEARAETERALSELTMEDALKNRMCMIKSNVQYCASVGRDSTPMYLISSDLEKTTEFRTILRQKLKDLGYKTELYADTLMISW